MAYSHKNIYLDVNEKEKNLLGPIDIFYDDYTQWRPNNITIKLDMQPGKETQYE